MSSQKFDHTVVVAAVVLCCLSGAPLLKHTKIKLYSRRFLTLALFGVSTLTNAMLWITFAPITSESMAFYGISTLVCVCVCEWCTDRQPLLPSPSVLVVVPCRR